MSARSYRPVRLAALLDRPSHPDLMTRYRAARSDVKAPDMAIGRAMLALMGQKDDSVADPNAVFLPPDGSQVHVVRNAPVVSSAGIVAMASTGEVIADTLDHTSESADGYVHGTDGLLRVAAPERSLRGTYLSLLLGGHENHFHRLVMNIGRLALLQTQEPAGLDGILIPADLSAAQAELVEVAGLSRLAPLHRVGRNEGVSVERLVLVWNVASGFGVTPDALRYLAGLSSPDGASGGTRMIYVDRRASVHRRLRNEAEIVELLAARGFEILRMETMSFTSQMHALRDAAIVVGPHGAGLASIVFARPGTGVVELKPVDGGNRCFAHLAAACGHRYDCRHRAVGRQRRRQRRQCFGRDHQRPLQGRGHPSAGTVPQLRSRRVCHTEVGRLVQSSSAA